MNLRWVQVVSERRQLHFNSETVEKRVDRALRLETEPWTHRLLAASTHLWINSVIQLRPTWGSAIARGFIKQIFIWPMRSTHRQIQFHRTVDYDLDSWTGASHRSKFHPQLWNPPRKCLTFIMNSVMMLHTAIAPNRHIINRWATNELTYKHIQF